MASLPGNQKAKGAGGFPVQSLIFSQPTVSGISGNYWVLPVQGPFPTGVWMMDQIQSDQFTGNGLPVVNNSWNAGVNTGFNVVNPATAQFGFQNASGSSTAQMEGGTVGAYLNSNDLPTSTSDQKMMITPTFTFPAGTEPFVFANGKSLLESADIQVPTAVGPDVFVIQDHTFFYLNTSGVKISFNVSMFHNGLASPTVTTSFDTPSSSYLIVNPLGVDQTYVSANPGSSTYTPNTWSGFRHFSWTITAAQFAAALNTLNTAFPGVITSFDPSQYILQSVHLNAELHTKGATGIQLGWSMRNLALAVQ